MLNTLFSFFIISQRESRYLNRILITENIVQIEARRWAENCTTMLYAKRK